MNEIAPRIQRLRARVLDQLAAPPPQEPLLLLARAWLASAAELWTAR